MYVDSDNTDRRRWFRAFRRSLFSSLEVCFYNSLKVLFLGLGYLLPMGALIFGGRPKWWVGTVLTGAGITAAGGYSVVKNGAAGHKIKKKLESVDGHLAVEKYNYLKRNHLIFLTAFFIPMSALLLDYSHESRTLDCLCAYCIIPMWLKHHAVAHGLKKYDGAVDKEIARVNSNDARNVTDASIKERLSSGLKRLGKFLYDNVICTIGNTVFRFRLLGDSGEMESVISSSSSVDSMSRYSSAESSEEAVMRRRANSYKETLIMLEKAARAATHCKEKIDGMAVFLLSASEQFANLAARQEQVGLGLIAFQAMVQRYAIEHNLLLEEEIFESLDNVQKQDEADERVAQGASGFNLVAITKGETDCQNYIEVVKDILPELFDGDALEDLVDEVDGILEALIAFSDRMCGAEEALPRLN